MILWLILSLLFAGVLTLLATVLLGDFLLAIIVVVLSMAGLYSVVRLTNEVSK